MSLIIEDGTMPAGANSYASVETCNDWQAARGSESWPAHAGAEDPNLAQKEAALIRAADYLNGLKWQGRRAAPGRVMAWPRVGAVDADGFEVPDDVVPVAIVWAQCYLAGITYDGTDLQPVLERGERIQTEKVGDLQTTYFDDAPSQDVYPMLVSLLGGLAIGLEADSGSGKLTQHKVVLS